MKLTFLASGTRGDVQPAIALGKALQAQGHQVRILAGSNFQGWIESFGLEAALSTVDIEAVMSSEGGREWVERGHNPIVQMRVMQRLLDQHGMAMIHDAWQASQDADAIVSSFTSDVYAVSLAEKLGIRSISMPLQPLLLATRDGRSITAPAPRSNSVSLLNYLFSKALVEPAGWRLYGKITNRFRQEVLGLPPQTGKENTAARRRMLVLLAYSRHVAPKAADWPDNIHSTGFWFLDEETGWQQPPALTTFLEAGDPPVYIGFGSMTGRDPEGTTRLVIDAVAQSGRRAILLSGWAGIGQMTLPDTILRLERAPHQWLFPKMAAVVHHGGAGTTAAGLRAGVPNIIIPHFADQPFWGQRLFQLGAGPKPIARHKLTAVKLATAIHTATTQPAIQARAAELGQKIQAENGLAQAVAIMNHAL